ncbi:bifunctional helix-turn-helix transcriptional regulator/GNAT family N-acetyltransferase [Janthinobacterium agaricidamnosum]|uniref:MarR family protein n=1 Tax=Janthinobacterium agaricidamnosum NBRC 102515 = DSM 9628 TaxID=1349767 RepID=W0V7J8_9BURK|nr:bifunctional helix-turn-helix transcriptional regulator/GNAT family N-acetyltransferase [Janthinobacterium agaricidamnosum]CDG83323.1 marR family protein [Janthinobacterium agaricidamnosum NBRC 102515 = DSM 9628]
MSTLHNYGSLLLASRLRRLSDQLYAGVDLSYQAAGVALSSRCFPLLFLLRDNGPTSITALAAQIGQSHPIVVQLGRKMLDAGVVTEMSSPTDERRRLLALSDEGRALMQGMQPLWADIQAAIDVLLSNNTDALLATLGRVESQLQASAFAELIAARKRAREQAALEIIDFQPEYAADFKRLNIEWLERYFYVEAIDDLVLSDPQTSILAPGGAIFLARLHGAIVGTCALIDAGDGKLELSKMAVTPACQGLGVGRRLLERALAAYRASGAALLYLESNSKLQPALALYESAGFMHAQRPPSEAHYQRANVYMEWQE